MKFDKTKKIILAMVLLTGSLKVMSADEKVICPSVNLVKQSWMLLDTVTKATPPKNIIWTAVSEMQDLEHRSWKIVTYADTVSMDTALIAGQNIVKQISDAKQKYATDSGDLYLCSYSSPNTQFGVGLISDKSENGNLKITTINLNFLK